MRGHLILGGWFSFTLAEFVGRPLLFCEPDARSQYEAFFYYGFGDHKLHAVRSGKWKLHLIRNELYDLEADIGEQLDVFDDHPDVVRELTILADLED